MAARVSVRTCDGDGSELTAGMVAVGVPAPGAGVEGSTEGFSAGVEGAGALGCCVGWPTEGFSAGVEGAGALGCCVGWPIDGFGTFV